MKNALLLFMLLFGLSLGAQTHRIGINGGFTTIASYDGFPPFGSGSPFYPQVGYVGSISYTYIFVRCKRKGRHNRQ